MKLREYQIKIIEDTRQELRNGNKKICIVAPCGSGKSVVLSTIIKTATSKGNGVLFLVHRKELIEQISSTMQVLGVDMDMCECYMVQTATRRLNKIKKPAIIVVDEVHHVLSRSYMNIIEYFSDAILLGFTATPVRMNEGGLGKAFNALIKTVSTRWLIDNNYLADYRYFASSLISLEGIKVKRGDYDSEQVRGLVEQSRVYGETVSNWERIAKGKKTIVYCSSITSSIETVEAFNSSGYNAVHLDGNTSKTVRALEVQKFRDGETMILSNVDLFGEGFDIPDCECVVLVRPTKSLSLYIQQSMRSMRYKEGKTAIIIDHVNNVMEHGLPDDDREWTLETKKRKKTKCEAPIRVCEECYAVVGVSVKECPECGFIFPVNSNDNEVVQDNLMEIDREKFKRANYDEYKDITTFEKMCAFQKDKKYKFGWTIRKCAELGIYIPKKYAYMARTYYGINIYESNKSVAKLIDMVGEENVTVINE